MQSNRIDFTHQLHAFGDYLATPVMIGDVIEKAWPGFLFDVHGVKNPIVTLPASLADASGFAVTN
jgi:hypothetical protein